MEKYLAPDSSLSTCDEFTQMVKAGRKISKKQRFEVKNVRKIVKVGFPELLGKDSMYNSKYKVKLTYVDTVGKERDKTVIFGHPQRFDFVDHKNVKLRDEFIKTLGKPKCKEHPEFEPIFWERLLLNGEDDNLTSSHMRLKEQILND